MQIYQRLFNEAETLICNFCGSIIINKTKVENGDLKKNIITCFSLQINKTDSYAYKCKECNDLFVPDTFKELMNRELTGKMKKKKMKINQKIIIKIFLNIDEE